jgi:uncharacterized membrane protein
MAGPETWRPGLLHGVAVVGLLLAVAGIGIASYLALENLQGNAGICAITHGCATVQKSRYGKMFGVPISLPGLALYLGLAALALAWLFDFRGLRPLWTLLGFAGVLCGTVVSAYLTYVEWRVLEAWCIYCIGSALLMTGLLAAWSVLFWRTRQSLMSHGVFRDVEQ